MIPICPPATQCNIPCADDPGSPCGGTSDHNHPGPCLFSHSVSPVPSKGVSAITQFQFSCDAPAPPAPAPPPGGCTTSLNLGCFMDPPTTMPYAVGQANSYEECAKACYQRGLLGSAGVKDGSSCMCSAEAGCRFGSGGDTGVGVQHLNVLFSALLAPNPAIGTPAYGAGEIGLFFDIPSPYICCIFFLLGICNTPCKANSTETCGSSNSINQFTFTCGIRYACIGVWLGAFCVIVISLNRSPPKTAPANPTQVGPLLGPCVTRPAPPPAPTRTCTTLVAAAPTALAARSLCTTSAPTAGR